MLTSRLISISTLLRNSISRRSMLRYLAGSGAAATATAVHGPSTTAKMKLFPQDSRLLTASQVVNEGSLVQDEYSSPRGMRNTNTVESRNAFEVHSLAQLSGVALAVEWGADGSLIHFESNSGIPLEVAMDAAKYGAALSVIAPGLADAYATTTGFQWAPYQALVACGGEWAAVVGSQNKGVWVKAAQADFNYLVDALNSDIT